MCIVSTRSASRNSRIVLTPPPSRTSLPCAASRACARAVAGSASTKWNVVSDSVNDGRTWWVKTKTGVWERWLVAPPALPLEILPRAAVG